MVVSGKFDDEERFLERTRRGMYQTIRATTRTCLAFKILAACRRCETQEMVRATFRTAFANIKPPDAVVVGMFDKHLRRRSSGTCSTRWRRAAWVKPLDPAPKRLGINGAGKRG